MATQIRWRRWAAIAGAAAALGANGACSKAAAPQGAAESAPPVAPAPVPAAAAGDKQAMAESAPAPAPTARAESAKAAPAEAPKGAAAGGEGEAADPAGEWDPKQAYRQAEETGAAAGAQEADPAKEPQRAAKADLGAIKDQRQRSAAEDLPQDSAGGEAKAAATKQEAAPAAQEKATAPRADEALDRDQPAAAGKLAKAPGAAGRASAVGGDALGELELAKPVAPPLQLARRAGSGGGKVASQQARPAPRSSDRQLRLLPPPPRDYPRDARYRSTYLPGRGYLQHLHASIEKSGPALPSAALAPQPARPTLPEPTTSALKVAIDLSHPQVGSQGGEVAVRVRLRSAEQAPQQRQPLRLHLVIDSSGSMKGQPWQQVCSAVQLLAQRLEPRDQLSVTLFSDQAWVMAAPASGGPLLGELAKKVCALKPRGETNTFAGLQLGYQQARAAYSPEAVNRVLLVSDGMATVGPREPYEITADTAGALGQGITTSGLGIGRDFDALLMNRIALEGGGNHHFVRDAAALPAVIVDELEVLSQQAAEAVDIRISLAPDVQLLEVVGSEPLGAAEAMRARQVEVASDRRIAREKAIAANRQRDFDGGVRFLLPAFRTGDEHAIVLRVQVPPGHGQREVVRLAVRYKDLIHRKNAGFVGGRTVQYAEPWQLAQAEADPEVQLSAARLKAGYALQRASEYLDAANLPAIRAELYAAALQLQKAADGSGSAIAQAESARVQALADATVQAMRGGHERWLASVFHYHWRMCGATAWAH